MAQQRLRLSAGDNPYWTVRENIITAIKANDTKKLKEFSDQYPKIFAAVVRQARNALARRKK